MIGSLVYWLEFKNDDELQTSRYGGIGGGSALKFGIYKRKEDGKWITGSSKDMRELDLNEAISIAREKRDLLVKGAELIAAIPNNFDDDTYLELQVDIDKELGNFGNLGWVHKYFHMLYPEKIDAFHSVDWQNFYLIKMLEKPIKSDGRYALAGQYVRFAKQANMSINNFTAVLMEYFGPLHNYWRVGTTDDTQSYWPEMLQKGYVSIGWPALGDLHQLDSLSGKEAKEHVKKILTDEYPNTPQVIGKSANKIIMSVGGYFGGYYDVTINLTNLETTWNFSEGGVEDSSRKSIRATTAKEFIEQLKASKCAGKYIGPDRYGLASRFFMDYFILGGYENKM